MTDADSVTKTVISKLDYQGSRIDIKADWAVTVLVDILNSYACSPASAHLIAEHLVDSDLCGVESHGVMRVLQYADQFDSNYMDPLGSAVIGDEDGVFVKVDGQSGHGIPTMKLAFEIGCKLARKAGISVTSIVNVGHTGRHGAFADSAAENGFMSILIGGGNRNIWRQVAPYGGIDAKLPTNPYCIGFPGDDHGPFVLDFATSLIAGGWIYAAQSAGAALPQGCVIDRHGHPTIWPKDYFNGGAILPAAGQKGYALALAAELIAEALLGPVQTECNWLLLTIDTSRMQSAAGLQARASEILDDIRDCRPAPGFDQVEIPGQRERRIRAEAKGIVSIPQSTWQAILMLRDRRAQL
ncbi:Ldh family oxidoreductase [Alphaproteobacteria bacterium]|nr:Ldh family oxidoreductase [Alphaproteobacteria bacterium]